ncbi:MAG: IS200/IS605 family transposase [Candidatus Heimdallarchaeota archaeon]
MRYTLAKSSHAVFALTYHYVCCVKDRRKIFDSPEIINRLKQITFDIAEKFGVEVVNQEPDQDHIHLLFKAAPTTELTKFVNSLKGVSSRRLSQEFPHIKKKLWRGQFWSPSYFLYTTGQVTLDQLNKYVESQGKGD